VTRSNIVMCDSISKTSNARHISLRLQPALLDVSYGGQPHSRCCTEGPEQVWRNFLRARTQIFTSFEEILSPSHRNFEYQNKLLRSSVIIIIIIIIIIINASINR